jgi:hypothetical protein
LIVVSPKKPYRCLISSWKGSQHQYPLGKWSANLSEKPSQAHQMAVIKKAKKYWKDVQKLELSCSTDGNRKWYSFYLASSPNVKVTVSLKFYSRNIPKMNWKYVSTQRLVCECYSSIFHDSQKLEGFQIWTTKQNGSIQIVKYYLAIKRIRLLLHAISLMNLKDVIIGEIRHRRLYTVCFHLCDISRKGRLTESGSRSVVAWY